MCASAIRLTLAPLPVNAELLTVSRVDVCVASLRLLSSFASILAGALSFAFRFSSAFSFSFTSLATPRPSRGRLGGTLGSSSGSRF